MGDGTKENPYTQEDVLKKIEENGGKAEGLDLSKKWFVREIGLTGLDLKGVILDGAHLEEACLIGANLEGAFLKQAHLENAYLPRANLKNADLISTHLEKAYLFAVHLEGAELFDAYLEEANLLNAFLDGTRLSGAHLNSVHMHRARFTTNTEMESIDWGNYILGEEKEWEEKKKETHLLRDAEDVYRRLKQWYSNAGMYDIAGKFFYREMEAKRKAQSWKKEFKSKLWSWVLKLLCGYGEKYENVVVSAIVIIFGLAVIYFFLGAFSLSTFPGCLYYSVVSFTALGYGSWVYPEPESWAKGLGAAEAALGVFMMALFLVTFTRKMTR